jgi:NAD(P)-dependent dehydrogenase (short-subunit alcohol dehydrogenase family)
MPTNDSRVWFVTGATSGFGRAMSQEILDRGERLVATGRDQQRVAETFPDRDRDRALGLELDVTDAEAARGAFDDAVAHFGRVDVVFNNAGVAGSVGAAEEVTDEQIREQIETNLVGAINVTRAALPHLRRQRAGHLLQMSSLNGVEGLPGASYYAAAKFGIEGFSESLADEVAPLGIKVTIVEPGPHRTRLLADDNVAWSREIADYADTVGATRDQLRELDQNQPGDPVRAVKAMIKAVESTDPPRRLPLGEMAIEHIRAKLRDQLEQLDAWANLSTTSDFPDQSAA